MGLGSGDSPCASPHPMSPVYSSFLSPLPAPPDLACSHCSRPEFCPVDLFPAHHVEVGVGGAGALYCGVGACGPGGVPMVLADPALGNERTWGRAKRRFRNRASPSTGFLPGFCHPVPTPCPQALGTALVGTGTALSSHALSPGPEPPFLGPNHQAGTLGSLGSNLNPPVV